MGACLLWPVVQKWHLLHGGCVLRREGCTFSSDNAPSDEKMAFSRRTTRLPTRRWRFLVGQRAFRREDDAFSSDNAPSDEKMTFSRRTTRLPTRRRHLLVDACVPRGKTTFSRDN